MTEEITEIITGEKTRREDKMERKEKLRREITDAMNYRTDGLCVGRMASRKVIKALGGVYGKDSVSDLLETAETPKLKAVHALLNKWKFIQLGKQRRKELKAGQRFCPHCGGRL